jgi:hypothetical protein
MDIEPENRISMDLKKLSSNVGEALLFLYENGDEHNLGNLNIDEILDKNSELTEDQLSGALSILFTLGLITLDQNGKLKITTKYAKFALGSILEFLCSSTIVAGKSEVDEDDREFMVAFTKALEKVRKNKIDNKPVHERRIVNIIIKGKQIRNWKEEEVYLHVYHPKWNAYHLVGLGWKKEDNIEQLIQKAMEIKLGLKPFQYEISPLIQPNPIEYIDVSGSHGAITKYIIYARVLNHLDIDVNKFLKIVVNDRLNKFNQTTFRWFTLKEIQRGRSDNNEVIMESTARVMKTINSTQIFTIKEPIDHLEPSQPLKEKFSNHINGQKGIRYIIATVISLLILAFFLLNPNILKDINPGFQNFANIIQILQGGITLIVIILGFKNSVNR